MPLVDYSDADAVADKMAVDAIRSRLPPSKLHAPTVGSPPPPSTSAPGMGPPHPCFMLRRPRPLASLTRRNVDALRVRASALALPHAVRVARPRCARCVVGRLPVSLVIRALQAKKVDAKMKLWCTVADSVRLIVEGTSA